MTNRTGGDVGPSWSGRIRSVEAASLAGVAFSALMTASMFLLAGQPDAADTSEEIAEFYLDSGDRLSVVIGLNLAVFAAMAFLWFLAVIRRRLGEREDRFFFTVFMGSGLIFVATYLTAAVIGAGPSLAVEFAEAPAPSPGSVGLTQGMAWGLFAIVAMRMAAVFMLLTSTLGRRTGALPRWLVVLGFVLALILLASVTISRPLGFVFPIWTTLVSLALLLRRDRIDAESEHGSDTA